MLPAGLSLAEATRGNISRQHGLLATAVITPQPEADGVGTSPRRQGFSLWLPQGTEI